MLWTNPHGRNEKIRHHRGMDTDVLKHRNEKYAPKWEPALQQKLARLRPYVSVVSGIKGAASYRMDIMGSRSMNKVTSRKGDTPDNESKTDLRWLLCQSFDDAELFDPFDALGEYLAESRVSAVQEGMACAAGRTFDKIIIDGILGDAVTGVHGTTTVPLPTTQVIPVDYVIKGTKVASGLTFEKLLRTKALLQKAEAYETGDTMCLALSSDQAMELLTDPKLTSGDYQKVQALINGEIDAILGFKVMRTEQLPVVANKRKVLAWVQNSVCLGIWEEASFKIGEREDKKHAAQVYVRMSADARRKHDSGVVVIECQEAVAAA